VTYKQTRRYMYIYREIYTYILFLPIIYTRRAD